MKITIYSITSLTGLHSCARDHGIRSHLPLTRTPRDQQPPSLYRARRALLQLCQVPSLYRGHRYNHLYAAMRRSGRASTLQSWMPTKWYLTASRHQHPAGGPAVAGQAAHGVPPEGAGQTAHPAAPPHAGGLVGGPEGAARAGAGRARRWAQGRAHRRESQVT